MFLTELRSMAELCEYVDIERMLRDKMFSPHGKLQELLLRDNKLTLDNAVSICRAFELTKRQVQEMSSTEQMVDRVESHVSKQPRSGYQDKKTNDTKKECQCCGYSHDQVEEGVQRGGKSAHTAMVRTISKQNAERKSIVYWRQMIRKMTMIGCKRTR